MKGRILLIEDHRDIAELVAMHVGDLGMKVEHVTDGEEGLGRASAHEYDLISWI